MIEITGNDQKMKIDKTAIEIIAAKIEHSDERMFKLEGLWEYPDGSRIFRKMQVSSTLTPVEKQMILDAPETNYSGSKIDGLWIYIENGKLFRGNGCGVCIESARRV